MNQYNNNPSFGSSQFIVYKDGTSTSLPQPLTTSATTPVGQVHLLMPMQFQIANLPVPKQSASD